MTRLRLEEIIFGSVSAEEIEADLEKYDTEASKEQIRHNLHSAIIEYYNEFDLYDLCRDLIDASQYCKNKNEITSGFSISVNVHDHKRLIAKGKL